MSHIFIWRRSDEETNVQPVSRPDPVPGPAARDSVAAGETVPSNVTLAGTALESGKSYIATVDGITEKTGESAETNYLTYDNGTLIVIGTVEITCDSAGLSFYNGTLTLAGNGDLTIAASGSQQRGVRFPSKHTDHSGGIFRQHYLGQRKCLGCPECGAGSEPPGEIS